MFELAGIGIFDGNGSFNLPRRDTAGNVGIWLLNGTSVDPMTTVGNVPMSWRICKPAIMAVYEWQQGKLGGAVAQYRSDLAALQNDPASPWPE